MQTGGRTHASHTFIDSFLGRIQKKLQDVEADALLSRPESPEILSPENSMKFVAFRFKLKIRFQLAELIDRETLLHGDVKKHEVYNLDTFLFHLYGGAAKLKAVVLKFKSEAIHLIY